MLSAQEVDLLILNKQLSISEKVVEWRYKHNLGSLEFKIPVFVIGAPNPPRIDFRGTASASNNSFSYVLLSGGHRLRCIDPFNLHHTNNSPDGKKEKIHCIHKHKFSTNHNDLTFAYPVTDIESPTDIEACFYGFLQECNIQHQLLFSHPRPIQYPMDFLYP